MLKNLNVKNFRGLERLNLDPLGRVNLIAGKNGTGKTAVLESLWILGGPDIPELTVRLGAFRGMHPPSAETIFLDLFHRFDRDNAIQIEARTEPGSNTRSLEILLDRRESHFARAIQIPQPLESGFERSSQIQKEGEFELVLNYLHDDGNHYKSRAWWVEEVLAARPPFPVPFELANAGIHEERSLVPDRPSSVFMASLHRENLQSDAESFGALQLEGREEEVLSVLRTLEPRLKSIIPISIKNTTVVHADLGSGRPIAIRLLGEGFSRMFSIAVAMGRARGGMILIDEVENGLHYSVLEEVFSNLIEIATKFDVQVFATTHSRECIFAAAEASSGRDEGDFTFHRIDRVGDHSRAIHFDREMVETAMLHDMEVR